MTLFTYIKRHSVMAGTIAVVAVISGVIAGRVAAGNKASAPASSEKTVTLVSAASFRNGTSTVSADGTVESHNQADLKSQVVAPVAILYRSIGDNVYPGQVILELQNSDIRAQLDQTQSLYGTARQSAREKVHDAYVAADNAVHGQIDQLIMNTLTPRPLLYSYLIDPQLESRIRDTRADLTTRFAAWKAAVDGLSSSSSDADIQSGIALSKQDLAVISGMLDSMSTGLSQAANAAAPSSLPTINSMLGVISGAKAAISGANASLTAADLGSSQASVENLNAQLSKTIVKSPISGTVSALPLRVGEFAAPGTLLATVVGGGGLEVKAFASAEDFSRIKVGAAATIQGSVQGIVSNIAPSVSADNKKAEVDIDIVDPDHSELVIGENVQAQISAAPVAQGSGSSASGGIAYFLPIQDVKIVPGAAYVLTVDQDSKIKMNPVTLGPVSGDFIQVSSGITDDMQIVTPVYELIEGQTVKVGQQ